MIRTFKDKQTERLWNREFSRKFQSIERTARKTLEWLNAAESLEYLKVPGLRLESLKGDRAGQYSIRINDQFRVCFAWKDGDAFDVEIADYH